MRPYSKNYIYEKHLDTYNYEQKELLRCRVCLENRTQSMAKENGKETEVERFYSSADGKIRLLTLFLTRECFSLTSFARYFCVSWPFCTYAKSS